MLLKSPNRFTIQEVLDVLERNTESIGAGSVEIVAQTVQERELLRRIAAMKNRRAVEKFVRQNVINVLSQYRLKPSTRLSAPIEVAYQVDTVGFWPFQRPSMQFDGSSGILKAAGLLTVVKDPS
jgi:hypothetical protein